MANDDDFSDFNPPEDNLDREERKLPPKIPKKLIPRDWMTGRRTADKVPTPPLRALKAKSDEMRQTVRAGSPMDWVDIHERFVDLWTEARYVVWRAKHSHAGLRNTDPITGREVQTYVADDRLVLQAIETTKGILDSIVKLRKEMGHEGAGIPGFVVERIERGLRDYPEALRALLKELAAEEEKSAN